jgi:hypothetical protein
MAYAEYANKEHYAHDAPNVLAWKILCDNADDSPE